MYTLRDIAIKESGNENKRGVYAEDAGGPAFRIYLQSAMGKCVSLH